MAEALADNKLYELSDKYMQLEGMLDDPDVSPEMLQDAFDDVGEAFQEKALRCALMFQNWGAAGTAVKSEIDRLTNRKKSFARKQEWMKGYLRAHMARLGLKKIEDPVLPISRRDGSLSVRIEVEGQDLPAPFTDVRTEFVPNKNVIAAVLKAHEEYQSIEHDDKLTNEQKELKKAELLGAHDDWRHDYIERGIFGARLQRGDDIIKIG